MQLRTLCFAANPETIHMHSSSVYGVLKLEESRFTCAISLKKQKNSKLTVLSVLSCVLDAGNWRTAGFKEGNFRDQYAVAVKKLVT